MRWLGVDEAEARDALSSKWALGSQCWWIFADPRPLATPISCKGALGLWNVPQQHVELIKSNDVGVVTAAWARPAAKERSKRSSLESAPKVSSSEPSPPVSRTIDSIPEDELLAIICALATAKPSNETELLRAASRHLGFSRMGSRVEQKLRVLLRKALEMRILAERPRRSYGARLRNLARGNRVAALPPMFVTPPTTSQQLNRSCEATP